MMGSGKTSVGRKLANLLSYQFIDVDEYIELQENCSIRVLFKEKGEEAFRELEHQYLKDIVKLENTVVSTGGGLPCHHQHMDLMNNTGATVYLDAEPAFLKSRLVDNKKLRPLIAHIDNEHLEVFLTELLSKRKIDYAQASVFVSSISLKPSSIFDLLKLNGFPV